MRGRGKGAVGDLLLLVALNLFRLAIHLGNAKTGPVARGAGRPTVGTRMWALDTRAFVLGLRVVCAGLEILAAIRILWFVMKISLNKQWLLRNSSLSRWKQRG